MSYKYLYWLALFLLGLAFVLFLWRYASMTPPHRWKDIAIGALFFGACFAIAALPPRFDPAIRLKEWVSRRKDTK